jgi:hypothetical protein
VIYIFRCIFFAAYARTRLAYSTTSLAVLNTRPAYSTARVAFSTTNHAYEKNCDARTESAQRTNGQKLKFIGICYSVTRIGRKKECGMERFKKEGKINVPIYVKI